MSARATSEKCGHDGGRGSFPFNTPLRGKLTGALSRPTAASPVVSPTCLMSSSLDTKRAALHDISNKGTLGSDKVREPRAASAMGTS